VGLLVTVTAPTAMIHLRATSVGGSELLETVAGAVGTVPRVGESPTRRVCVLTLWLALKSNSAMSRRCRAHQRILPSEQPKPTSVPRSICGLARRKPFDSCLARAKRLTTPREKPILKAMAS